MHKDQHTGYKSLLEWSIVLKYNLMSLGMQPSGKGLYFSNRSHVNIMNSRICVTGGRAIHSPII